MTHAAPPGRDRRGGRATPSRAPVPRARGRERPRRPGRRRPPRGRSGARARSARSAAGRARAEDEVGGHEARPARRRIREHRVDVLVGEDRGHDRVVVAVELLHQVARTVGIVRTVPDLALPALEAPRERDVRCRGDRVARRTPPPPPARRRFGSRGRGRGARTCRREERRSRRRGATASFSVAIASSVSPRTSVCSSPTFVSRTTRVRRTFVASYRPPSPASTTATSTAASANACSAAAVTISNWVALEPLGRLADARDCLLEVGLRPVHPDPLAPGRDVRRDRRADRQSPSASRSCSIVTVAVDLPFVPTTWIAGYASCGSPSSASSARIRSSPKPSRGHGLIASSHSTALMGRS